MQGEVGQMIWLAGHGTAWLAGRLGDDPPSGRGVGWFRHVASVAFSLDGAKPSDDLPAWLRGLRDRGIDRLWLVAGEAAPGPFEERYLVAFAGAGSWSLVGTGHAGESWRSTWTVGDLQAPDQRIWLVDYRGTTLSEPARPSRPPVASAAERLLTVLRDAEGFARSEGQSEWADVFLAATSGGAGLEPGPDALLPTTAFADDARSLAARASAAWVFGGMGSWNDVGFTDPEVRTRYERVSEELYRAVLEALVAATNAELT